MPESSDYNVQFTWGKFKQPARPYSTSVLAGPMWKVNAHAPAKSGCLAAMPYHGSAPFTNRVKESLTSSAKGGSGKTALARMFVDANPRLFPPGTVETVSGPFPFVSTSKFELESAIKKETSALILDAVPWSMESIQQIQACLKKHPLLRVITTGSTSPPSGFGSTVTLAASLTDSERPETLL